MINKYRELQFDKRCMSVIAPPSLKYLYLAMQMKSNKFELSNEQFNTIRKML